MSKYLETAILAARRGGEQLKHFWGRLSNIKEKGQPGNLVTEADYAAEQVILQLLSAKFPSHQLLAEESGMSVEGESEYLWVIDPLDGTTNYTHQYPMVAISIALIERGAPLVGVVYNPFHEELFTAEQGKGAYLNGSKITVSTTSELSKSLLATGFAYGRRETDNNNYVQFCRLTDLSQGVRRGGAAALDLSYVAAGRLDGFWERGLKPWDMAAGILLISEAGGAVTLSDLSPFDLYSDNILASNGSIHRTLSRELCSAADRKISLW